MDRSKCTPSLVVQMLYRNLKLIEKAAGNPIWELDIPNYSMMSVFMAVSCIEAFMNLYFRQLLELPKYSGIRNIVLKQMSDKRFGLEQKTKCWPKQFFGKDVFALEAGKKFNEYRQIRNHILHYKHTYEQVDMLGIKMDGLTDSSLIHNLDLNYMLESRKVVKDILVELFKASGCSEKQIKGNLQLWTGEIGSF